MTSNKVSRYQGYELDKECPVDFTNSQIINLARSRNPGPGVDFLDQKKFNTTNMTWSNLTNKFESEKIFK